MGKPVRFLGLFYLLVLFSASPSSSFPLCTDLRQPSSIKGNLTFCSYNGKTCCSSTEDLQLQKRFQAMNISDSSCASAVKSVLCATCDPFSAKLFNTNSEPRSVPILCNSTSGVAVSSLSTQTNNSFCSTVWESCQDVSILDSPFAPALQSKAEIPKNATLSKLTDLWQSESDFCDAFGGASDENSICFNGQPVSLNKTDGLPPPKGMCLEKIRNGSYINMVPHPDGSNRAFFSNLDTSFGMMGMAFHPNFATNGRFFASFNCDKEKSPGCGGRCACNSDVGCDPSQLGSSDGAEVCKYHTVIAEYSANGTASTPSLVNGFRNPWRCSFDSERPSYFLCADVGQDQYEEVDIISKGGNYGWRVYEGPLDFKPQKTPGGNTSANSIDPIYPVLGYSHADINKLGSAAISGGYFYRSQTDPCTFASTLSSVTCMEIFTLVIFGQHQKPQKAVETLQQRTLLSAALQILQSSVI